MVWGGMSYDGVGPLTVVEGTVTGKKYRQTLQKHLLPLVASRRHLNKDTILQDDNAPLHQANLVTSWKRRNNLKCMEWPAQGPDLNPIENLWMTLKRAISARNPAPRNVLELQVAVEEEWKEISLMHVRKLVTSMPKRIEKLSKQKVLPLSIQRNFTLCLKVFGLMYLI